MQVVQDRLLPKLSVFARHRRDSHSPFRGEDLFGYLSSSSRENTQASITFFTLLLQCLRSWASQFAIGPDGLPSDYSRVYEVLVKEGVWFGDQAEPGFRPMELDIEAVRTAARKLQEQAEKAVNRESGAALAMQLGKYKDEIVRTIEKRTNNPTSEQEMNLLLDISHEVSQALDRYESLSKPQQPLFLEERKSAPADIDFRLSQLQREVTDARNQLFERQTNAQGIKSPEQVRKETSEKLESLREEHETALAKITYEAVQGENQLPGLQQRINELMAQVDHAKMRHDLKLKDLENLQNQRLMLRAGNASMRERLKKAGISAENPEDYSAFLTQRDTESVAVQMAPRSPEKAVNLQEFRHLCYVRDGLLYRNEELDAVFEMKLSNLEGRFRVTLVNKSPEVLKSLELVLSNEQIEGLRIETQPLAPSDLATSAKIYRLFSISVSRAFQTVPNVLLSYTFQSTSRLFTLHLPIIYPLFITPLQFPLERVIANWEGLSEWEACAFLPVLHPALKKMADVGLAAVFQQNFVVLTNRELQDLDRGEVMCLGQINQFLVWTRIEVRMREGQAGAQVVVRCRNLDSRTCLLNTLVRFLGRN